MVRDMTESITRIRGTGLPGSSPFGIMLPLLQIRLLSPPLSLSLLLSLSLAARSFMSSLLLFSSIRVSFPPFVLL